jgi:protease YdgD
MNRFLALGMTSMGLALAAVPFAQASLPWRAEADAEQAAATAVPILTDFSDFGIDLEINQSSIPAGLGQSDNPTEGGRVIIGPDNRQPMTSSSYPWTAVGQIVGFMPDGSSYTCTGTLVADDLVLTNAHCAVDPATGEYSQRIVFLPNLVNGRLTNNDDVAAVTGVLLGTDFAEDRSPEPDDWALMSIDKPLGQTYGTIGLAPLPSEVLINDFAETLIMVGYSGDFPAENPGQTASAHKGCSIVEEALSVLLHLCDTTGGASGGPILALVDGEYRIVALHAAGRTNRETGKGVVNFAVTIPRIVSQLQVVAP